MRKTLTMLILFLFTCIVAVTTTASAAESYKLEKGELLKSKPTQAEIQKSGKINKIELKTSYEDCWSFCDEVCMLMPGGVCYCRRQSYDCGGDPTSPALKDPLQKQGSGLR